MSKKFQEWRKARKEKREARRDPYDKEEVRLKMMLEKLDPTGEDYSKVQKIIDTNNKLRKEGIESKRRIPIEHKVSVLLKVLGLGGVIVGAGSIIKAEKEGMIFTGEKKTLMESITRVLGNLLSVK